jgi:hypothetical protein
MKRSQFGLLLFAVALAACTVLGIDEADSGQLQTQIAQAVAATLTAAPPTIAALPPTSSPAPQTDTPPQPTPIVVASAAPPISETFTDAVYALDSEQVMGAYVLRIWRNTSAQADPMQTDRIATLSAAGQAAAQVDFFASLDALTGQDITGDGTPDVVIETYSGGAHCCFSTVVYELGPVLFKALESPMSNCGGRLTDLNGDGILEFDTCDDIFAYTYCPYAASPLVRTILQYETGRGYVPASHRFSAFYADDVARYTQLAERAAPGEYGEWDETTKCAVLPVVLAHLYSGNADRAWAELARLYAFPDRDAFKAEIEATVRQSALFAAP